MINDNVAAPSSIPNHIDNFAHFSLRSSATCKTFYVWLLVV